MVEGIMFVLEEYSSYLMRVDLSGAEIEGWDLRSLWGLEKLRYNRMCPAEFRENNQHEDP